MSSETETQTTLSDVKSSRDDPFSSTSNASSSNKKNSNLVRYRTGAASSITRKPSVTDPAAFSASFTSISEDITDQVEEIPLPSLTTPNNATNTSNAMTLTERQQRRYGWLWWWNTEDWWSCWIGLSFFGMISLCVERGIQIPAFQLWSSNPFDAFEEQGNLAIIVLFPLAGILLYLALFSVRVPHWLYFPFGYTVTFALALLAKVLASNEVIKHASIGDSIWAILLGMIVRNLMVMNDHSKPLPGWLKVGLQTELYIAVSLVLLCIDFSVLGPLAPRALFASYIDTPILFVLFSIVGFKWLGVDLQTSIIMSGATMICGSSAAVALAASMGAPTKAQMPIAIISVFTIPSLIALPYVAKALHIPPIAAGAWFGGCVDSTGAVIASATIYGDKEAINTAAIVKMLQNSLIGPLSVAMTGIWARYEAQLGDVEELNDGREKKVTKLSRSEVWAFLWLRFPKFVIGFLITAVLFNLTTPALDRQAISDFCFYVSEWFSTLSFVSIGMNLQIFDLRRDAVLLARLCTLYTIAQISDIFVGFGLSWLAFVVL